MVGVTVTREALARPVVQQLLARSVLYEALALMLASPEDEVLSRLDELVEDLDGNDIVAGLSLQEALDAVRRARPQVDAERLAPVHFALFEGSVLCSPHETEYVRDALAKAAQLADIAGFYHAFGLKVSRAHPTTPDDIATELEFMALITRREAYAEVRGWPEHAETARLAGCRFLESHLGRWVGAFTADLCARCDEAAALRADPAAGSWFHAVGELLRAGVQADLDALGVHPSLLRTRVIDPDADAFTCPFATAAPEDSGQPLPLNLLLDGKGPAGQN